jgi:DNA-binding NarL/FixJ family response regulator
VTRGDAGKDRIRCVIADDHPAIVDAVSTYLELEETVDVVGRAGNGADALQLVERRVPDVAVLDLRMPRLDGIDATRQLVSSGARTAVILYTGYPERSHLLEALDAGARGFLGKEAPLSELVRAITIVASGRTYVDPSLAGVLVGPEATARLVSLSKREREVLRLLADGLRNEQVASSLAISPLTVRTHVRKAMEKLEADTRTQAVATALRESLIS